MDQDLKSNNKFNKEFNYKSNNKSNDKSNNKFKDKSDNKSDNETNIKFDKIFDQNNKGLVRAKMILASNTVYFKKNPIKILSRKAVMLKQQ